MYSIFFRRGTLLCLYLMAVLQLQAAAPPDWQITPTDFQHSMTITAQLKVSAEISNDPNDMLGIFVAGILRGVGNPSVEIAGGQRLVFVQVYSNVSLGEILSFQIYDASEDRIIDAITALAFQADLSVGSVANPYLITDNYGPADIVISNQHINENLPAISPVGDLGAVDPDAGETFTFSLVTGAGDDDNAAFSIDGNRLQTVASLDYEAKNSYTVRIRATDASAEFIEEVFIIQVNDLNDPPTRVLLSANTVPENSPLGTKIATLSVEDQDINPSNHVFTLVEGGVDNSTFLIDQNRLLLNAALDYEIKDSYSLRIRANDTEFNRIEEILSVSVINMNEPPLAILPSTLNVNEQTGLGSEIATLSALDPDDGDTHSFQLLNESATFSINGDRLLLINALDFETRTLYFLDIQVTDGQGLSVTMQLVLTVENGNEAPTDLVFAPENIDETLSIGGLAGRLEIRDEDDGDVFNYNLIIGTGDEDNASFTITNDEIHTAVALDFETQSVYAFRVRAEDRNNRNKFVERAFILNIRDSNEAPTALALSNSTVNENSPPGTAVGQISTTDLDQNDTHIFTLVTGVGDTDNTSFLIDGTNLMTRETLDFEASSTRSVRVQVIDEGALSYEQSFTINLQNTAEVAEEFVLSNNQLQESSPLNTEIGTFSLDGGTTLTTPITYSLLASVDMGNFLINGNRLLSAAVLDYEQQIFYTLRVQAEDNASNTVTQDFVIVLNDRNESPTGIMFIAVPFAENQSTDVPVGSFSTIDPDAGDTFVYLLVSGEGDSDNDQFVISSNQLRSRVSFDFETRNSYSARVRSTDPSNNDFEQIFTILIQDVNEAPTSIQFTPEPLPENQPLGTRVGAFSAVDPDASENFTYALVSGAGDTDNSRFFIANDQVFAASTFDYEETPILSIRVRVRDKGNLPFEEVIVVQLQDVNDPHTNLRISGKTIPEGMPSGTVIGTLSVMDSDNSPITYRIIESSLANAFRIQDNTLFSNRSFDFEQQPLFRIRIAASDEDGNEISEAFQIDIINADDPPSGMELSNTKVDENKALFTPVGTFLLIDEDGGGVNDFTFTLIDGPGSDDNSDFVIAGNNVLQTAVSINYEQKASHTIRVRALGSAGEEITRNFTIEVQNVNDIPTQVTLSETMISENQPAGTLIGLLSCEDEDATDVFTYRLQGEISEVALFEIRESRLYSLAIFNHETKDKYNFSIQATDRAGASIVTPIQIAIIDENDPPELQPATLMVPEGSEKDTFVGRVHATETEIGQDITYQFYFSPDEEITNNNFYIDAVRGDIYVRDPEALDYEVTPTQQIEVQATDDGVPPRSSRRRYTIEILDVAENTLPAPLILSPNGDGMNDNWVVQNVHLYSEMKLTIFSSLGQVVYSTLNYQNDWNAMFRNKPLPRGVYYYVFVASDGKVAYRGTISILN